MKNKGLFLKYEVKRIDGKSDDRRISSCRGSANDVPGYPDVEKADYFVLKLNSGNKYEIDALIAYAESCEDDLPELSRDLFKKALIYRRRFSF